MKGCSSKAGCFALSVLTIALSQAVYAADEPVATQPAISNPATETTTLPEVTVTATSTADTQGYVAPVARSATKTNTPLLETPIAIQVVSHEVTDDRAALTSLDAVKNVSGVQAQPGTFYDQFNMRGFNSGYGVTFRNGLQLEGIANAVDMAFVDRIEVVKGPSSVLYGRVEPGGFINVVTKKPQAESAISLQQQAGSWGTFRTTADMTGAVNGDKTVLYRVIGAYDKGDSFIDYVHHDNKALATYFSIKPSSKFDLNFNLEHYDGKMVIPANAAMVPVIGSRPADLPRNFSNSDPIIWSNYPYTTKRTLLGFDWTYGLSDNWKLTNRFHYVKSDEVQTGLPGRAFDGVSTFAKRGLVYNPLTRDIYGTNLDLTGEFLTGDIKHKLLAGLDWYRYADDWNGRVGQVAIPLNIYAPVYGNIGGVVAPLVNTSFSNKLWKGLETDYGVYLQDKISLNERWDILLGGRYDRAQVNYSQVYGMAGAACYPNCTGEPLLSYPDGTRFSPRAAVLYKLSGTSSLYGSYSKSFGSNNSSIAANGSLLPPEIGIQYELGAKSSWLDGKVNASATFFNLTKQNVVGWDANGFAFAVGEIRSQGIELDLAGQVSSHVSLIGSYTYDDATITKDPFNGNQGRRYNGVAPHVASLWAKYDTAPGAAEGWTLGAGEYLMAQRQGDDANTWQLPGYGKVDAMAAYRTKAGGKPLSFQLNVKNLFDKKYFEATDGGTNAYYGAPRSVTGSLKIDL